MQSFRDRFAVEIYDWNRAIDGRKFALAQKGARRVLGAVDSFVALNAEGRAKPPARHHRFAGTGWETRLSMLNYFLCPYPIPEGILWAAFASTGEFWKPSDHLVRVARKWAADLASGGSFYKKNKRWFTRREAHLFLSYKNEGAVLTCYYKAKFESRHDVFSRIPEGLCDSVSEEMGRTLAYKFRDFFDHRLAYEYIDWASHQFWMYYLATGFNYPEKTDTGHHCQPTIWEELRVLEDIADFIADKIKNELDGGKPFSLKGRTLASVRRLTDAWHLELATQREQRTNERFQKRCAAKWKGLGLPLFEIDDGLRRWKIAELTTGEELFREGAAMRNCVFSYTEYCEAGRCAIFDASVHAEGETEKKACIEVDIESRKIVQVRATYNNMIDGETAAVLEKWAAESGIALV